MRISENFELNKKQNELEFLDVKLESDNLLFINPNLIVNDTTVLGKQMSLIVSKFWLNVYNSIKNRNDLRTIQLLNGLGEPKETRLGYSSDDVHGNSVGKIIIPKIIDNLKESILVNRLNLRELSNVELFIEKIGPDRISDITTKIIKSQLIKFTQEQCSIHNIPTKSCKQKNILNNLNLKWGNKIVSLPHSKENDKPIIFVPKKFVRDSGGVSRNISQFYRFIINFVINKREITKDIQGTGKKGKVLKKDIKNVYPKNKKTLQYFSNKYPRLLADYKSSNIKTEDLTDNEINRILSIE